MTPRLSHWYIHPLLLAAYPVLFLYTESMATVAVAQVWRPMAVSLATTTCVLLLLRWRVKSIDRVALALSLFLVWVSCYGYLRFMLPLRHRHLLPLYLVTLLLLLVWLARTRMNLRNMNKIANVIAISLVVISLARVGAYHLQAGRRGVITASGTGDGDHSLQPVLGYLPDIYYIVLDSYARGDILKQRFGEDNSSFIDWLRGRGFYVAAESRCNYAQTTLSLGSSLNMDYLDIRARRPVARLYSSSRVVACLKRLGYTMTTFPTDWETISCLPADRRLGDSATLTGFETALAATTVWDGIAHGLSALGIDLHPNATRTKTSFTLENLPAVPREDGPVFVFAHIMPPHPPFVFGRHGEDVSLTADLRMRGEYVGERERFVRAYRDQVAYVSAEVREAIDGILSSSRQPPVILLQADHGPRVNIDWDHPSQINLDEIFSILNAYYLPERDDGPDLYPGISPANSFRVVLNHCFGAGYELLEDASFFSHPSQPYDLVPLTMDSTGKLAMAQ